MKKYTLFDVQLRTGDNVITRTTLEQQVDMNPN